MYMFVCLFVYVNNLLDSYCRVCVLLMSLQCSLRYATHVPFMLAVISLLLHMTGVDAEGGGVCVPL